MKVHAYVRRQILAAAILSASAFSVLAQSLPPDSPLSMVARRGGVELLVGDIDTKLRSIPADLQAGYMTESDRATRMIESILLSKQMAARARADGIDQRADFKAEMAILEAELLSRYLIDEHLANTPVPKVDALAKERYLADPEKFRPAPRIDVSHILITTEGRTEDDAKRLAEEALKRAKAGEDFLELAAEYGGKDAGVPTIQNVDFSRMDPKFALAIGELDKPGDIHGPVRSQFGYHVIRLDAFQEFPLPTFDMVKPQLVAELTRSARDKAKNDFLDSFAKQPVELNDATVRHLKERYLPGGAGDVTKPLMPAAASGK